MNIKVTQEFINRKILIEYYKRDIIAMCEVWVHYNNGKFTDIKLDFSSFKYKNKRVYNDTFWEIFKIEENIESTNESREYLANEITEFIKCNYNTISDLNMLHNVKR